MQIQRLAVRTTPIGIIRRQRVTNPQKKMYTQTFVLLGYFVAQNSCQLPTFRDNISVPSLRSIVLGNPLTKINVLYLATLSGFCMPVVHVKHLYVILFPVSCVCVTVHVANKRSELQFWDPRCISHKTEERPCDKPYKLETQASCELEYLACLPHNYWPLIFHVRF